MNIPKNCCTTLASDLPRKVRDPVPQQPTQHFCWLGCRIDVRLWQCHFCLHTHTFRIVHANQYSLQLKTYTHNYMFTYMISYSFVCAFLWVARTSPEWYATSTERAARSPRSQIKQVHQCPSTNAQPPTTTPPCPHAKPLLPIGLPVRITVLRQAFTSPLKASLCPCVELRRPRRSRPRARR